MTELQRISARLAGMSRETERHCDALDDFTGCASGGVASSEPDPEAGNGAGPLAHPHSCARCGLQTRAATVCAGCDRDLELHRERLRNRARPYCGECGDTGREPHQVELGSVGLPRWQDEAQPCDRCPCCEECGVELRLHPRDTMECR
jgi:hypothetical protein